MYAPSILSLKSLYLSETLYQISATDPFCKTNVRALQGGILEGDYIQMCITYTNTAYAATSSLMRQLTSSDNGVTFICKTSFKPTSTKFSITSRLGEGHATNVPHYQHLWNSTPSVLCKQTYAYHIHTCNSMLAI